MYPMPQPPGSPYYPAPRRGVPDWVVVVVSITVAMCLLLGVGVGILFFRIRQPGAVAQTSPASVGQSLIINNVTVTLTSAQVSTVGYLVGTGQAVPGVTLSLHFWNRTTAPQRLYTGKWRLLIDGGSRYYPMLAADTVSASLQPNETQDAHFTIEMNTGDHGPYTLQTDFTTPQGQPLAWTFSG